MGLFLGMGLRRFAWLCVLAAIGFLLIGAASVGSWEYTNSDHFCTNACHQVHPEEPVAHKASHHAEVACVECHIGRLSTFEAVFKKAAHSSHVWALMTGYERPLTSPSLTPSEKSCESCHSSDPHKHDSVYVRKSYDFDEENTETITGMILRTAAPAVRAIREAKGVYWHTRNQVRFIASDSQQEHIPWVEATYADGKVKVFKDEAASLSSAEIEKSEKHTMDCIDCHNRVGHPFHNPEEIVDMALARGDINQDMPNVKARAVELLQQEFTNEAEAQQIIEKAWQQYEQDAPEAVENYPEVFREAKDYLNSQQTFALKMLVNSSFSDPDVSWRSFADKGGHKYSPGCFRCHSNRHVSDEGDKIRTSCTLCHSVPVIIREGEVPQHFLTTLVEFKPRSHKRDDFIEWHQKNKRRSCENCHGEDLEYGKDDSNFCANSGCHDREWPGLVVKVDE